MRTRLGLWLIVLVSSTLASEPRIERPAFASLGEATIGPALHGVESPAVREAQPEPLGDVFRPDLLAPPPGAGLAVALPGPHRSLQIQLAQPPRLPDRARALGARGPPLAA